MTEKTRSGGLRERLRPGVAAGRVVRASLLTTGVVLALVGGSTALWLSADRPDPRRTAARVAPPTPEPPIRLDTIAPSGAASDLEEQRTGAKAAPVIGVGTERFNDAERERSDGGGDDPTIDVDGRKRTEEVASDAEVRRELAALERENARIEAALRGLGGPGRGTGKLTWPVRGGTITSPFGQRWGRLHAGVDIGVSTGSGVYAADSGRVAVSGTVGGYGNYICIQHTSSLSTCYAHNSRLGVRKGESVRKGAMIAKSGCTGRCYGPHLHFETRVGGRPVNPMRYF
jgi:murein DD-endopeptidase MepM/ murein hydrolase activator NlpD